VIIKYKVTVREKADTVCNHKGAYLENIASPILEALYSVTSSSGQL